MEVPIELELCTTRPGNTDGTVKGSNDRAYETEQLAFILILIATTSGLFLQLHCDREWHILRILAIVCESSEVV